MLFHVAIAKHAWKCYNCKFGMKNDLMIFFYIIFSLLLVCCSAARRCIIMCICIWCCCYCHSLFVCEEKCSIVQIIVDACATWFWFAHKKPTILLGPKSEFFFVELLWSIKFFTQFNLTSNRSQCRCV